MTSRTSSAFALVEIVVALAMLASVALFAVSVQRAQSRSIAAAVNLAKTGQLVDPVLIELTRLRDRLPLEGETNPLTALAARIPEASASTALRFVVARDGTQIMAETDLDQSSLANGATAWCYLVEVRQQPGDLRFVPGLPFLAVTLRISWPYQPPGGVDRSAGTVSFNAALTL